jgi:hypothetical protein
VRNCNHFKLKKTKKKLVYILKIQINSCVREHKKNQKFHESFLH